MRYFVKKINAWSGNQDRKKDQIYFKEIIKTYFLPKNLPITGRVIRKIFQFYLFRNDYNSLNLFLAFFIITKCFGIIFSVFSTDSLNFKSISLCKKLLIVFVFIIFLFFHLREIHWSLKYQGVTANFRKIVIKINLTKHNTNAFRN